MWQHKIQVQMHHEKRNLDLIWGVSCLTSHHNASGDHGDVSPETANVLSEPSIPTVNPSLLKDDQFCAYDIITWHLEQT